MAASIAPLNIPAGVNSTPSASLQPTARLSAWPGAQDRATEAGHAARDTTQAASETISAAQPAAAAAAAASDTTQAAAAGDDAPTADSAKDFASAFRAYILNRGRNARAILALTALHVFGASKLGSPITEDFSQKESSSLQVQRWNLNAKRFAGTSVASATGVALLVAHLERRRLELSTTWNALNKEERRAASKELGLGQDKISKDLHAHVLNRNQFASIPGDTLRQYGRGLDVLFGATPGASLRAAVAEDQSSRPTTRILPAAAAATQAARSASGAVTAIGHTAEAIQNMQQRLLL